MTRSVRASGIFTFALGLLSALPPPLAADTPPAPASTGAPAAVDTEPPPAQANMGAARGPWHEGVAPADQEAAIALFEEGLALQRQWLLPDAAARYEQALARWEHPKIRFYLGRTQEKMGELVNAYENLRLALRWGMDAFPAADARLAREMLRRLEAGLSRIEVRCDEPGAEVFLDGKPWFVGPGSEQAMVRPGEHAVIARKVGFSTVTRSVSLVPSKRARLDIWLSPEIIIQGRWERWRPWHTWTVAGVGAALALAGGVLEWQAARDYQQYEQRFLDVCADQALCHPYEPPLGNPGMEDTLRRARWENRGAIAMFSAAGVALSASAVLRWLDRPQPRRNQDTGRLDIELAPLVTQDGAGVSLGGWF